LREVIDIESISLKNFVDNLLITISSYPAHFSSWPCINRAWPRPHRIVIARFTEMARLFIFAKNGTSIERKPRVHIIRGVQGWSRSGLLRIRGNKEDRHPRLSQRVNKIEKMSFFISHRYDNYKIQFQSWQ
jgi:hypothetical protein